MSAGKPAKVERVRLRDLRPDPDNARTHSEASINSIAACLLRFGQQKPIVATPDGTVVAGNGVLAAAQGLGWSHLAVVRTHLEGVELVAYALADNLTAELSEWDLKALCEWAQTTEEEVPGWPKEEIMALSSFAGAELAPTLPPPPDVPRHPNGIECICPKCSHEYLIHE